MTSPNSKTKKKYILIVEDDPFLADIYTTRFEEEGFKVRIAEDGAETLRKIKEKRPHLLLLDIVLPGMDGWEIIKNIKKEPKLKDLIIVVFSNLDQESEVKKGLGLGAIKYLIKAHYTPTEVVKEIKKILR